MGKIRKAFSLLIILFILSILIIIPASAQTVPRPSVPEFTVQYADRSYNVSESTSIDPFTGKTVTNPAELVKNETIQITIKNQTITNSEYLYYEIRMKGHFSQEWTNISFIQANPHSENTSLLYSSSGDEKYYFANQNIKIPSGGALDFQVQAQIWTYAQSDDLFRSWNQVMLGSSDWSETQTLIVGDNSTVTNYGTPTSTPDPILTNQPTNNQSVSLFSPSWQQIIMIISLSIVVLLTFGLLVSYRRRKQPRPAA